MDPSFFIGIAGSIAALVSAVIGYWFGRRSEFAISEWMREVRSWATEVIKILSEAIHLTKMNRAKSGDLKKCEQELSALIEVGRFYLPNQTNNSLEMEKPIAYRGFRHAALDPLVAAIRIIQCEPTDSPPRPEILRELQREFVSALFRILGPDHYNKEIGEIIRTSHEGRRDDITVGGLLPGDSIPGGATAILDQVIFRLNKSHDEQGAKVSDENG